MMMMIIIIMMMVMTMMMMMMIVVSRGRLTPVELVVRWWEVGARRRSAHADNVWEGSLGDHHHHSDDDWDEHDDQ